MELNTTKQCSPMLLSCGGGAAFNEKLLLKPKTGRSLQTERLPRSSVLEQLQGFLPRMAEANEKLKRQMEQAPPGSFDIESVEEDDRVIEMDVALVELESSVSDSEEEEEEESDSEEDSSEITEQNLKLPGHTDKKKNPIIQVLQGEEGV
uniref:NOP protein chaperone 1 n=1 Tax=Oryzias sinensis TaxID=183150 RepID=A0A8C7YUM2_9TELE